MTTKPNDPLGIIPDRTPRRRRSVPQQQLPDNVRPNIRTHWLDEFRTEGDSLSWTDLNQPDRHYRTGRSPDLLPAEVRYIRHQQLDWEWLTLSKAAELKPWWAAGYTARDCALSLGNRWGYRVNTTKKYWALYNRHASPIE